MGIIIYSTDAETIWNAFRLGNFALKAGDQVSVFLLAKGVECASLSSEPFDVVGQMKALSEHGGQILACGTCLKMRNSGGTELCPLSTMKDLYELVKDADKVVSF
ncbi:MAG: sulfur reduction protein DsrE [Verrucomicrobia bacterium]|nr:MAG: sulfur reduction protein DsrE [Verrucomicrobiota bacterium]